MSTVIASGHVQCPAGAAEVYLRAYLDRRQQPNGRVPFQLHAPVPDFRLGTGTTLAKEVSVRVGRESGHGTYRFSVDWIPEAGGPFPSFDGMLVMEPDTEQSSCTLTLQGAYEPPGGTIGRLFDAAVGSRIAQATLDDLLNQFREIVENEFRSRDLNRLGFDGVF